LSECTALYRAFDSGGLLLYVGISKNFGVRWRHHAKNQPWWDEVQRLTVDLCASRSEAMAAELAAIRTEGPKYNIAHVAPDVSLDELLSFPVTFGLPEAARVLGVSTSSAYGQAARGKFPCRVRRYGTTWVVTRPDLFRALGLPPDLTRKPEEKAS